MNVNQLRDALHARLSVSGSMQPDADRLAHMVWSGLGSTGGNPGSSPDPRLQPVLARANLIVGAVQQLHSSGLANDACLVTACLHAEDAAPTAEGIQREHGGVLGGRGYAPEPLHKGHAALVELLEDLRAGTSPLRGNAAA